MSEKPQLQALPSDQPLSDSADSIDSHDYALEKRVIRKCDLHLVPILFLLFLCAFVDRSVALLPLACCFASLTHQQYQYRQCQDPRTYQRPKYEGRRLQYRIVHVLHPVHSSGSSQQHDTKEAPSFGLDKYDYVLLGCVACRSMSRVNSELIC